jgi:fumarate reductase flavoprotein subunit
MAAKLPNSSRRKFMMASSAVVAAPLLLNVPGVLLDAKAQAGPQNAAGAASKASSNQTTYFITRDCTGCHTCRGLCPAKAIHWGDAQNEIDQSKCLHCGTCYDVCPMAVISATQPDGSQPAAKPAEKSSKVMDCDLVVLGAGGSGLIAAVKAADISGKKVIVLEKGKRTGGNTTFATGFMTKDSQWHKEAGQKIADPPDISGQFFDWLVSKGGAEDFFVKPKAGESAWMIGQKGRLPKYKNNADPTIGPGKGGTYVVEKMLELCKKMDIPVLTETRAKRLVTDKTGKVVAVLADTPDGELKVNCKACVVATGGFGASYEKCKKIWPLEWNNKPKMRLGTPHNTGDGIDMAEEIGVAIDLSDAHFTGSGPVHHPYSYAVTRMAGKLTSGIQLPMCVNLNGERWLGEKDVDYDLSPDSLANQPEASVYFIVDQDMVDKMGDYIVHNDGETLAGNYAGNWREEIAEEVALDEAGARGNHTKKADTFLDLALKMHIDPKVFVATMEAYNEACENGGDPAAAKLFDSSPAAGVGPFAGKRAKPPNFVSVPINKPPYYAMFCWRFTQTTKGGLVVDYQTMEVYDKHDKKIPGLFAVGDIITAKKPFAVQRLAGLSNCTSSGYKGGTSAGNYLKNL